MLIAVAGRRHNAYAASEKPRALFEYISRNQCLGDEEHLKALMTEVHARDVTADDDLQSFRTLGGRGPSGTPVRELAARGRPTGTDD